MSSRQRKRRLEREAKKRGSIMASSGGQKEIQLVCPAEDNFETFIFGNSLECDAVVPMGDAEGKTVAICGAGPSLERNLDRLAEADEVWGVNSAAVWLYDHGHPITHAITVDQNPQTIQEWASAPPLKYLLASTVHPHLTKWLKLHNRPIEFFHSYVGIKKPPVIVKEEDGTETLMSYEDWVYLTLYPGTVRTGHGLNSTTRAVDLAGYRGFSKIMLLGADCAMVMDGSVPDELVQGSPAHVAWLEQHTKFHVNGDSAVVNGQSPITLSAEIDGRVWTSKIDLVISAVTIAEWIKNGLGPDGPELEVIGDTLPNAIWDKPKEWLDRLPIPIASSKVAVPAIAD